MLPPAVSGFEQAGVDLANQVDEPSGGNNHALIGMFAVRRQVLRNKKKVFNASSKLLGTSMLLGSLR